MTSSSTVAPTSLPGRLNAVAPDRAKKIAKRLHKIADRHQGVLRIHRLAEAQEVVAELFGLPSWHALQHQTVVGSSPNFRSPSAASSTEDRSLVPSGRDVLTDGWTWYVLQSENGHQSVQAIASQIRAEMVGFLRPLVTNGLRMTLAIVKHDNPASMSIHLGIPVGHALVNDPGAWAPVTKAPIVWQHRETTLKNLTTRCHALDGADGWTVLHQDPLVSTDSSAWLSGRVALSFKQAWVDELDALFERANAWWSVLAERPGHTSLTLELDGTTVGAIHASVMVGLHDPTTFSDPIDTWSRLRHSVDMVQRFPEMRPKDHNVGIATEAWPWDATEHLALVDAYDPTQALGWDPQSPLQTTHVATIAPANPLTRQGWTDGVLRHLGQVRSGSSMTLTALLPDDQVQRLKDAPVGLVPWDVQAMAGFNPFRLPTHLSDPDQAGRPDPAHRSLLIAGLLATTGFHMGMQEYWSMLLDRAYLLRTPEEDVSVRTLLNLLDDDPSLQGLFQAERTLMGEPVITKMRRALTSLSGTMLGDRQPEVPSRLALPVGRDRSSDLALTWFAMAYTHLMRPSDAWVLDATACPSLMSLRDQEALVLLTSQQRRHGNRLMMLAHAHPLTAALMEMSTLAVSTDNPSATTMQVTAYTHDGRRTRTMTWATALG